MPKLSAQQQEARLRFILDAQTHCDHFLTPLADPAGKTVVVLGAGAGTDILWCLRHGAREVVGLDILEQDPQALQRAIAELGLADSGSFELQMLPIEQADSLGRRFDLVLSNNVFEHVPDLPRAMAACARLVAPGGRVAIFTDPLYYSSAGAHLPLEPWEHLWGAPLLIRERLLAGTALPAGHALESLALPEYLDREISLNRMRLSDFVEAVRASGLVFLNLRLLRDRRLGELGASLERLSLSRASGASRASEAPGAPYPPHPIAAADLAIEGLAAELALPTAFGDLAPSKDSPSMESTEERVTAAHIHELEHLCFEHGAEVWRLHAEIGRLDAAATWNAREAAAARAGALELRGVLEAVERSWSFRLGRALTAPARRLSRLK